MQKTVGITLVAICAVTSVASVRFHQDAIRYRAELAATQEEAIKLKRDLALSAPTVRVYEPTTHATPTEAPSTPVETASVTEPDSAGSRVQELELQIQDKDRLIAALQQQKQAAPPPDFRQQRPNQNWDEVMKTNDPERYKQMIKEREEARSKVQKSFAEKADHFLKQDTSGMTDDEVAAHEQMLQVLDQTWQLAEQLQADTPRDQRWQIMRQLRDNVATLEPAMKDERTKEWYKLSTELGYKGDDATAFVQYLDKIVDVTSMSDIYQTMRRGRFAGRDQSTNTTATIPAR